MLCYHKYMLKAIPHSWQGLLWSRDIEGLDWDHDKVFIIHQVLMYGTLDQISQLVEKYGRENVQHIFVQSPKKVYTSPAFHFIKNYLLMVDVELDPAKYVRSIY